MEVSYRGTKTGYGTNGVSRWMKEAEKMPRREKEARVSKSNSPKAFDHSLTFLPPEEKAEYVRPFSVLSHWLVYPRDSSRHSNQEKPPHHISASAVQFHPSLSVWRTTTNLFHALRREFEIEFQAIRAGRSDDPSPPQRTESWFPGYRQLVANKFVRYSGLSRS